MRQSGALFLRERLDHLGFLGDVVVGTVLHVALVREGLEIRLVFDDIGLPPSFTRAVAQLEASAGVRLIERTTRRFAFTEAGKRHVETYRTMLNALARLDASAADIDISGTVVVTAPELFGRIRGFL